MKKLNLYLSVAVSAILSALLFVTAASAQDPATEAAQQAVQAAQQASQQAMQMQQQAVQQAQQAAQAAQDASSSNISISPLPQFTPPQPPLPPTGPVAAQIAAAHAVLLTSVGASPNFPVDSSRVYNDVYAALKAWGHYQLVETPQQADLIFQLREVAPIADITGGRGYVYSTHSPAFVLTMVDPKTQLTLWTITSPVYLYGKKEVYEHWVALSEANLISRIKVVAGQQLSGSEQADLVTVPKTHYRRNVILLTSAIVAAGLAGGLILHHEYENSLANMKSQQDAFCTAHGIPLNMCPGG